MIHRSIGELRPGEVVARPVYADDGRVLLRPGTVITERYVDTLRRRGVPGLYVQPADGGALVPRALSDKLRAETTDAVAAMQSAGRMVLSRLTARDAGSVLAWLTSAQGQKLIDTLPRVDTGALASALVDEVLAAATDSVLRVEKSVGDYAFAHSVDVATVAVAIGRRLGLARPELIELARGSLVHDIGMALVDPAILAKAGPLTAAERAEVEPHARLGFELLRVLQPEAVLPNHVVLQHHERQDGSGYPQALRGGTRVSRNAFEPGRREIVGLAEICAVADVYDALSSPRPYRPALPPDQVRAQLRSLGSAKLNVEAVGALLQLVPLYPVGGRVTLLCRQFPRHRGQIVRRNVANPERPVIRLMGDEHGGPVAPVEIDLSVERGILIRPAV
jgi:HD-GYP domain-containing protein (c-di-GMP phosphodiesterase class II)